MTLTTNGRAEREPAWWQNLQAHPPARVQLTDGTREVVAHAATGQERAQLWDRWRSVDKNLDGDARRRSTPTAVVVLEPRTDRVCVVCVVSFSDDLPRRGVELRHGRRRAGLGVRGALLR